MTGQSNHALPLPLKRQLDTTCDEFEAAWKAGHRPRLKDYVEKIDPAARSPLLRELLALEMDYRRRAGEPASPEVIVDDNPELRDELAALLELDPELTVDQQEDQEAPDKPRAAGQRARGPLADTPHPERIGRYRIEKVLGKGGCACVYLAHDEELNRAVAVKVPLRERIRDASELEAYLAEARIVAQLDHPGIVPVYDVGTTDSGLCFVVSRYVLGSDLATRIKRSRPSCQEAVEIIVAVAEALHYAHKKGLAHRDIKPANILLDAANKPYVTDFGLALQEQDLAQGSGWVGTPAYMSPEQARGEGHLVDGRSDIYSLGVVLYELLTGHRPFRADTPQELLQKIASAEIRPPRQRDETIPVELERVCLKALANRASDRYSSAFDMAQDLRQWLQQRTVEEPAPRPDFSQSLRNALDMLLPYLANREEHEQKIVQAIEEAKRRNDPCLVCCLMHGAEDQCHDTFAERLRESTLRKALALSSDQPVKQCHLFLPTEVGTPQELGDRLRTQLAERLRLPVSADEERIALALAQTPWPTLVYSELATRGQVSRQMLSLTAFLDYWENLPLRAMRQPVVVCLGIIYRRGTGYWGQWLATRRNGRIRRHLESLDFGGYRRVVGVVLPELRNVTLDDADNWLRATIDDLWLRQDLRPKIRDIFRRVPEISMEQWREARSGAW